MSPSIREAASRPPMRPPMLIRHMWLTESSITVLRICPARFRLHRSQALNNATLPFGLAIAGHGLAAVTQNPHLRAGLNVHRGRITNRAVAGSLGLSCPPIEDLIAASTFEASGWDCRQNIFRTENRLL